MAVFDPLRTVALGRSRPEGDILQVAVLNPSLAMDTFTTNL